MGVHTGVWLHTRAHTRASFSLYLCVCMRARVRAVRVCACVWYVLACITHDANLGEVELGHHLGKCYPKRPQSVPLRRLP